MCLVPSLGWECCSHNHTSPRIMPWLTRRLKGSLVETTPKSYNTLCQNLAYSR
jgi:hypothetical protein